MKTFEEALKRAIDAAPFTPGLDDGGFNGGFIDGLEHAQELLDIHRGAAINEILTKYHEWALSLPGITFVKWDYEEVYPDKTKARMRKEFINFLNKNNQNETK